MPDSDTPRGPAGDSLSAADDLLARLIARQETSWRNGQRVGVEDLVAGHPDLNPETLLELVYNEAILRESLGEALDPHEYSTRFPHLRAALSLQWNIDRALLSGMSRVGQARQWAGMPERVGRYEIQELQGKGGVGVAYRAWDPLLKRVVIVKMLRSGAHADAEDRRRFRIEAEALARLRHPNIVQVFDVGEHEGQPYLALEFCAGGSLADRLRSGPLSANVAAHVVVQIAHGVAAAHAFQIIHRDLKPSNILFAAGEEACGEATAREPKVTDFGLAKQLGAADDHTQTGAVVGTPAYMAPEQAFGSVSALGPAVDVYALGAILYECLTGRPPFQASTTAELLDHVRHRAPARLRHLQRGIPADLETITLKCLHKEPPQRYPSAGAVAEDLTRFLESKPIVARPIGWAEQARLWYRRNPRVALMVSAIALLLVLLAGGSTAAAFLLRGERDTARGAEQRAVTADRDRRLELYRAYVVEIRSVRRTGQAGHRERGLEALRRILAALPPEELTDEQRAELRDEALASLAFMDARELLRCDVHSPHRSDTAVDGALEFVASPVGVSQDVVLGKLSVPASEHRPLTGADPVPDFNRVYRAFSPNGKWLVELLDSTSQARQTRLRVRDRSSGAVLANELLPAPGTQLVFHPKEPLLYVPALDSTIREIALPSGQVLRKSPPRFRDVQLALDPTGTRAAVVGVAQPAEVIALDTWSPAETFPQAGHTTAVAWSHDGRQIILGTGGGGLYRWFFEFRAGHFLASPHGRHVADIHFSADDEFLASTSVDEVSILRRTHGDQVLFSVPGRVIRFADEGLRFALADRHGVSIQELRGERNYRFLRVPANDVQFSPDGNWLAVSSFQGVRFLSTNGFRHDLRMGLDPCGPVVFHPDRFEFITFGLFSHVWRWPVQSYDGDAGHIRAGPPQKIRMPGRIGPAQWNEPQHFGRHMAFSRGGEQAVLADHRYNRVLLADGEFKSPPRFFAEFEHVARVAMSPDCTWIAASALFPPRVRVWQAVDAKAVLDLPEHENIAFSPDGRWFVCASKRQIRLYRVGEWKSAHVFDREEIDETTPAPVAFQPHGPLLAFTLARGKIRLFDCDAERTVAHLIEPEGRWLQSLSFNNDGTRLAIAGAGWDVGIFDLHQLATELTELGLDASGLPTRHTPLQNQDLVMKLDPGAMPPREQWSKYWLKMAQHELNKGDTADAVAAAESALRLLPDGTTEAERADYQAIRGRYHRLNDNPHAARDDWQDILRRIPMHPEASRLLARLCLLGPAEFRDPRRAVALLAPFVNGDQPTAELLTLSGIAQIRLGQYQMGLTILQKISDDAFEPLVRYFIAVAEHHLNQHQSAQSAIRQATASHNTWRPKLVRDHALELEQVREEVERVIKK